MMEVLSDGRFAVIFSCPVMFITALEFCAEMAFDVEDMEVNGLYVIFFHSGPEFLNLITFLLTQNASFATAVRSSL